MVQIIIIVILILLVIGLIKLIIGAIKNIIKNIIKKISGNHKCGNILFGLNIIMSLIYVFITPTHLIGLIFGVWVYGSAKVKKQRLYKRIGDVPDTRIAMKSIMNCSIWTSLIIMISYIWPIIVYAELLVCPILLIIQQRKYNKVSIGYKSITNYVNKTGFFHYENLLALEAIKRLISKEPYVLGTISRLESTKTIYRVPLGKMSYMNKTCYTNFQKGIKKNASSSEIIDPIRHFFTAGISDELIYGNMYTHFTGNSMKFNNSIREKQKAEAGDISDVNFVVMRYSLANHPIANEEISIRESYIQILNYLLLSVGIAKESWADKLKEYLSVFQLGDIDINAEKVKESANILLNKQNLKRNYNYLLLLESIYFEVLLRDKELTFKDIEEQFDKLTIERQHRTVVYEYIRCAYIDGDASKVEELLNNKKNKKIKDIIEPIHRNIMWSEQYMLLPQYQVAVCATMSAGKSTFINAILGEDYIPTKNEACTAKVTTIRDNDNISRVIGCYVRTDEQKIYANQIERQLLEKWNEDTGVSRMVLETDIKGVGCNGGILALHDTPGTNNSADATHHDITIEFLKSNNVTVLLYLINAEYISTTDTEILLREIQSICKEERTKTIFVLNKIDCFDAESGEDVKEIVGNLITAIKEYGYDNPVVFPISANAARLFKLVLNGKEITKREKRAFQNMMDYFSGINANMLIEKDQSGLLEYMQKQEGIHSNRVIEVNDEEYTEQQIWSALYNTGVPAIEAWLDYDIQQGEWITQ